MRPRASTPLQRHIRAEHVAATALLLAIVEAGDRLREARAFDRTAALPLESRLELLDAIARCGGAPSFSDLARKLRITRWSARERVIAAAQTGVVELLPSADDRRVVQVALTAAGRRLLEARGTPPLDWVFALLDGLEPAVMRSNERILRTLSERLARFEREMRTGRARQRSPGA